MYKSAQECLPCHCNLEADGGHMLTCPAFYVPDVDDALTSARQAGLQEALVAAPVGESPLGMNKWLAGVRDKEAAIRALLAGADPGGQG